MFNKFEEMAIGDIAIAHTESIILEMANIVMENRRLREEVVRLRKVEEEYHQYVQDRYRASEQTSQNVLKAVLTGIALGEGDTKSAREISEHL